MIRNFLSQRIHNHLTLIRIMVVFFYVIATVGFCFPFSTSFFRHFTPWALLLSTSLLFLYHSSGKIAQDVCVFLLVAILGWTVEVIGVNTGIVFGEYKYGYSLGIGAFGTPFLIGVNWGFMVYSSSSLVSNVNVSGWIKPVLASILMVGYDLFMEAVAPFMDMWSWSGGVVPLQNFIAWFLIALVFQYVFFLFNVNTKNKLAPLLFFLQVLLFVSINAMQSLML